MNVKPRWLINVFVFVVVGLGVSACERFNLRDETKFFDSVFAEAPDSEEVSTNSDLKTGNAAGEVGSETQVGTGDNRRVTPFEIRGSGQLVSPSAVTRGGTSGQEAISASDGGYSLNFVEAELPEVVRAVLEDALSLNYSIDPRIQGTVTLQTSRPLRRDQVLPTLEEVLRMSGAALIESDGLLQVVPGEQVGRIASNFSFGADPGRGQSVRVLPLRFVSAAEVETLLKPFVSNPEGVQVDRARNLLFVTGSQRELTSVSGLAAALDVNGLSGMSFALIPLQNVAPDTITGELETIFNDPQGPVLSDLVRFVPIERMNAVLIITKQPRYLDEARSWVARLDQGNADTENVHVYYVQNRRAADLAKILSEIFASEGVEVTTRSSGLAPNVTPTILDSDAIDNEPGRVPGDPAAGFDGVPGGNGLTAEGAISLGGTGKIRIIADEDSNSLVTLATLEGYRTVEAAIRQLDILPLQVLIEATIAEVTLNDDLELGLRWFFESGRANSSATFSDAATSTGAAALGSAFPGFSYVFDTGNIRATLNALRGITDVKFLSAPTLLVLDNQTARLQVGDEVPVVTQSSVGTTDANAPIVNSVEFRDTGVILDITPRVNASGLVILDIEQEVSEVTATTTSGIDSPTIQQRKVKSTVAVYNQETIALGGLIRDRIEKATTGIPVLSEVPLVGNLFKSIDDSASRTELLVLIKPRVVRNQDDARAVTEELRQKLPGLLSDDESRSDGRLPVLNLD
ncbi:type II secretion system secretin GspD [Pelagibius sp. Alg239-R121]|uniref:type II secretion system secretin GspD n=1 Tax=Pelagibius sp. Alg239-R121 TaxID=2993448 RepID=UPI0024A6C24C|nr:type II secretion system secretin GspD [Pelagibius sp. Alg239-R121]